MTQVFAHFSNIIIPVIIFYIVAYGITVRTNVYEEFIKGAKDGFHTVIQIMPTLIGLMVAVGVLRASGFLDFLGIGYFQESRAGFPDWHDHIHHDELYGDGILHDVRILYGGQSDQNAVYACRRGFIDNNGCCRKHCARGYDALKRGITILTIFL